MAVRPPLHRRRRLPARDRGVRNDAGFGRETEAEGSGERKGREDETGAFHGSSSGRTFRGSSGSGVAEGRLTPWLSQYSDAGIIRMKLPSDVFASFRTP